LDETGRSPNAVTKRKRSAQQELSKEELETQEGEALPDREAMSLVNLNVAIPVDAAIAANVLADESVAEAEAVQEADIEQET
jgi:hypothetical protein